MKIKNHHGLDRIDHESRKYAFDRLATPANLVPSIIVRVVIGGGVTRGLYHYQATINRICVNDAQNTERPIRTRSRGCHFIVHSLTMTKVLAE